MQKNTHFTRLVVLHAHLATLHGSLGQTHSQILGRFWILNGKSFIRSVLRNCVICARFKAKTAEQIMAPLPEERVTPQRPFLKTGVDYAGPFWIRSSRGRGIRASKGYICLFVCLVTKAVHLELVSDLSTQGFLSAFQRFVSRRGKYSELFSDNATNFKGAASELNNMFREATTFYSNAAKQMADLGTNWTFIPPSAPHFGRLLEAGVKSVKHHLRRVIGEHRLTIEEIYSLLCEIKACLNSRPLYPTSNDPDDPIPLTPGNFLISEPLTLIPEPPSINFISNKYKLVTNMRNPFWKRWHKEYIQHLH